MAGKGPKTPFLFLFFVVIAGLIALAVWRSDLLAPKSKSDTGIIDPSKLAKFQKESGPEAPDSAGITTVKEYDFVPAQKLPPVTGISNYRPLKDDTVRFALNVWAGWSPIIFANEGFRPGKLWSLPGGKSFKVELVLIDDPVAMRDAYAAGEVHIGWATLDMVPLLMEELRKDSRVMPRIYQQIDWSNGGDGIVVRDYIKSVSDLRGKKIVLAQNSPSHYFVLN